MFQQVSRGGGLLFVIGMVGRAADGTPVEGGIRAQTRRSLERIEEVLTGEGKTRADIVRLRFYVVDMRRWPDARDEIEAFFGDAIPPSTAVGVTELVEPELVIEIDAEAVDG
jgi:enamine deaminase RidA (YjgF/YER057c/UK114 family)